MATRNQRKHQLPLHRLSATLCHTNQRFSEHPDRVALNSRTHSLGPARMMKMLSETDNGKSKMSSNELISTSSEYVLGDLEEPWLVRLAKKPLGYLIYCLLMLIYIPFYIIGFLAIQRGLCVLNLRRATGLGFIKEGKLGLVSRRSRVTDVSAVSTENEIDFLTYRSPAYLWRMCFSMPWELVKTILRQEKIQLISDEQLAYTILNSVFAHSVRWDEERQMYRLMMEGFEDLFLFQGFYWDARNVLVHPSGKKIIIQMSDGKEYSSGCEETHKATYNLAKLHVQVCLSYFAPGLSHNHVHFVMPSALAVLSRKILNKNGVLYKLFYQHFRFTERINFQALRVQKATNNKRSALDRLFFFWQPFPLTKEQFLEGVARKCKKHYFEKGLEPLNGQKISLPNENEENGEITEARTHQLFPPDFVTDEKLRQIPYLNFLAQYYFVIRDFIKQLAPFIDKEEWKRLSKEIAKHVPRFDESNMIDAISTAIHQVGVIHFCDHNSYIRYFAFRYGSMAIRVPFEPFEHEEDWLGFEEEYNINLEKVKVNPINLIRQRDILRTRSFLKIFVDYIPNPQIDLTLVNTDYGFYEEGPKMAKANFIKKLHNLDKNLKNQKPSLPISANPKEDRAEGMRLVPLPDIIRTVCY